MLFSYKSLTLDVGSDPSADVSKYGGLVVSSPEDFVGCGFPEMMPSTLAIVKFNHDPISLLWIHTFQKHPQGIFPI